MNADEWNEKYPIGTVVDAAPGLRREDGGAVMRTKTRSIAWTVGGGQHVVVAVKGYPGGIHLDHITVVEDERGDADQPPGIHTDSTDLPDVEDAAARVLAWIAEWGDGEVTEGLYARDLCVLAEHAKT